MKKFVCCLLIAVVCTSLCGFSSVFSKDTASKVTLEETLQIGLENCLPMILLAEYNLTLQEVTLIYQKILESEPQLFHVSRAFTYTYDPDGTILSIMPTYIFRDHALNEARKAMIKGIHEIISDCKPTFSEGDKVLFIHDYLAQNYTYSPPGIENYDAYSLLTEKHGVCQAFSLLFVALGRCIGLEADMVTSLPMDHAWNHVKVDGQYYHVDVTRDLPDKDSHLHHERFLLSDEALEKLGYRDYVCHNRHTCFSHTYETIEGSGLFEKIDGSWLYADPHWIGVTSENHLVSIDLTYQHKEKERLIYSVDLDHNGKFSLEDVLHPLIQEDTNGARILQLLRQELMMQALVEESY